MEPQVDLAVRHAELDRKLERCEWERANQISQLDRQSSDSWARLEARSQHLAQNDLLWESELPGDPYNQMHEVRAEDMPDNTWNQESAEGIDRVAGTMPPHSVNAGVCPKPMCATCGGRHPDVRTCPNKVM